MARRAVDLARALQRACRDADKAGARLRMTHQKGRFVRGYILPPLAEARTLWAEAHGLAVDWPAVAEWT